MCAYTPRLVCFSFFVYIFFIFSFFPLCCSNIFVSFRILCLHFDNALSLEIHTDIQHIDFNNRKKSHMYNVHTHIPCLKGFKLKHTYNCKNENNVKIECIYERVSKCVIYFCESKYKFMINAT